MSSAGGIYESKLSSVRETHSGCPIPGEIYQNVSHKCGERRTWVFTFIDIGVHPKQASTIKHRVDDDSYALARCLAHTRILFAANLRASLLPGCPVTCRALGIIDVVGAIRGCNGGTHAKHPSAESWCRRRSDPVGETGGIPFVSGVAIAGGEGGRATD